MDFAAHRFLNRDGLQLYYRDYPAQDHSARSPVVCLHGLTRNGEDFEEIAIHLQARRRVLTLDLRGRGESDFDPDNRRYRLDTYVADVSEWLDRLHTGPVVLFGTSLGGLIAMAMAQQQPQRLAAVILNDIGAELAPAGVARIAAYVGKLEPPADWAEALRNTRTMFEQALPDLDAPGWERLARRTYREQDDGSVTLRSDPAIGLALDAAAPVEAEVLWAMFGALKPIPALALRGELSDLLSASTLERMQTRKPDLQTVTVPHRGHVPLLNEPASLRAIDSFLATVP